MRASAKQKPTPYASKEDFCRVFDEEMTSLYLLAFLLTADSKKAEQCFVSGLQDSSNGTSVFREWALSWARWTIVQNAIRLIKPQPRDKHSSCNSDSANCDRETLWTKQPALSPILQLPPFPRFVFVMSVLNRYSDQDCSLFLGCTRRELAEARSQLGQRLGELSGTMQEFEASGAQLLARTAEIQVAMAECCAGGD